MSINVMQELDSKLTRLEILRDRSNLLSDTVSQDNYSMIKPDPNKFVRHYRENQIIMDLLIDVLHEMNDLIQETKEIVVKNWTIGRNNEMEEGE